MEPLESDLKSLVQAERAEVEPGAQDRERIGRALAARVGIGFGVGVGLVSTSAAGAATATGMGVLFKVGAALLVVGAATAIAVPRWSGSTPATEPAPSRAPVVVAAPVPPVAETAANEPSEPAPSEAKAPPRADSSTAERALPPLAEEARLLKQAQRALRDGQGAAALAALSEHQRRFPRGQLAIERSAARVQALCALGQKQQAEREARAFVTQHPGSGLAAQVKASCGFAAPSR